MASIYPGQTITRRQQQNLHRHKTFTTHVFIKIILYIKPRRINIPQPNCIIFSHPFSFINNSFNSTQLIHVPRLILRIRLAHIIHYYKYTNLTLQVYNIVPLLHLQNNNKLHNNIQ